MGGQVKLVQQATASAQVNRKGNNTETMENKYSMKAAEGRRRWKVIVRRGK